MQTEKIKNMALSGLFIAIGMALPFLTGQIPNVGSMLLPMHLPALLCGFVCGWPWGLAVGAITPILRSFVFGMPPLMPTAIAMSFELATYGAITGLAYAFFPKKLPYYYLCLILAMLIGRAAWGLVSLPLYLAVDRGFGWGIFWTSGFVNAVPGILVQFVLLPPLVLALEKAKIIRA